MPKATEKRVLKEGKAIQEASARTLAYVFGDWANVNYTL